MKIFKFAMRTSGAALAATAVAGIGAIITYSIASTLVPPEDAFWGDLRCLAGYPLQSDEKCLQQKLEEGIRANEAAFNLKKSILEEQHRQRESELNGNLETSRSQIGELEKKSQALETEKAQVVSARSSLEERLRVMEKIEASVSSFNLFTTKSWRDGLYVTTGVEYPSFVKAQEWEHGWCYVQAKGVADITVKISLATQHKGQMVVPDAVSDAELSAVKLTRADIDQARLLCSFPASTS